MKKVLIVFVLLVAGLSTVLYVELREQRLESERPSGGSGTVEGTEVDVVTAIPGRIASIHADEGDTVARGEVLVELECSEPKAALKQAEAAVDAARAARDAASVAVEAAQKGVDIATKQAEAAKAAARATSVSRAPIAVRRDAAKRAAERVGELAESGGISDQDVDRAHSEALALNRQVEVMVVQAEAANAQAATAKEGEGAAQLKVKLAQAQLTAANKQVAVAEAAQARAAVAVGECSVRAPRAGVVSTRNYEPGEMVLPGTRVLTLVDLNEVRATFYLPNAELGAAKAGGKVSVVADAWPDASFEGVIRRVGTEAEFTPRNVQTRDDRDRLVYAVEISVPNPDGKLREGMPVEIEIPGTGRAD